MENGEYQSCGKKLETENKKRKKDKTPLLSSEEIYQSSCPICRLFGSLSHAGRLSISDAYADGKPGTETRDGVGIDRFTGGAFAKAKFELEPVISGTFKCSVYMRNFEIWQLGLLGCLMKDLKDGYIYIGSGKSRGLGEGKREMDQFLG